MRVLVAGVWVYSVGLEFTGCFRGPLSFFAQPAGILRGPEMPPREVANAAFPPFSISEPVSTVGQRMMLCRP